MRKNFQQFISGCRFLNNNVVGFFKKKILYKATVHRTTQQKTIFPADKCSKRQYLKVTEPARHFLEAHV